MRSRKSKTCGGAEVVTIRQKNIGILRLAEPSGRLDQRVQHRLQVKRRATDDLEYLRSGGVLLHTFCPIARGRGALVCEARILVWDEGLGRRRVEELERFFGQ